MIRINLLGTAPRAKSRLALAPTMHGMSVTASLLLLATALSIGWRFWSLREISQQLDEDLAHASVETQRLQSALAEAQRLETRRAELQKRASIVEQLGRDGAAAAQVLDVVASAVPDGVSLSELVQKDSDLTLRGLARDFTSVSALAGNLKTSGLFRASVEVLDIERMVHPTAGGLARFSVRATVTN